ncbi:class I SAM-dependent methyltransferase [Thauera phenolivorans]|uniref:class I SAM-dependent methyltransferase n=1 Tax=Thauera phenolivorans TaxID=1792543 RepID=UPI00083A3C69|nr:class I SAM-dependent methyltransferase [Thauera phenolivorans]
MSEPTIFDHGSDPNFLSYYADSSVSDNTLGRFTRTRNNILRLLARVRGTDGPLRVADIGCGAGTCSQLWAKLGHSVHGLDVNAPLIELAGSRAAEAGLPIEFRVGSATQLPYADAQMDVVLLPELLEHVADWELCLKEAARVLAPGGLLFLSTTNALCPIQDEFDLPMYSWYPGPVKRYYERLSVTTRPELVRHTKYPAVHWFSFYQLRDYLARLGLDSLDRFDAADDRKFSVKGRAALRLIRRVPLARWIAHVLTPDVTIYAINRSARA